jgi:NAD(P)-dependent dehydrogenase (short-subunit alcohol dehydrogenase family)
LRGWTPSRQFCTLVKSLPLLSDGASIIVTVGIGATRSLTGNSLTAGSRGALLTMIPSLALELVPRRIRVNAVSPGFTDTPMLRTTPGITGQEIVVSGGTGSGV